MKTVNYDRATRYLHWLMAIIIIYATCAGYAMHLVIDSHPNIFQFLSVLNMSLATIGSIAFIIRWIWKYFRPVKSFNEKGIPQWQSSLAHLIHSVIYQLMLVVFISGFLMLETSYELFWLITIPNPITSPDINSFFFTVHRISCAALALVVLLHASAALKHHFVTKNLVLKRMLGQAKVI
ncbi:cytochrome B [Photobacterium sanctipauli]|uniref:Cytochrome B n=1 Tax=Photobacterium sanctipauli TaxID=1342794 RepID=A0A2T3P0D7_9GAMM|nr:cytochrome b/b6 domain-containing protein [Photobacterium sanctipauli]PSW21985.1 cytochrome B [Photobacterium sanctipauli]